MTTFPNPTFPRSVFIRAIRGLPSFATALLFCLTVATAHAQRPPYIGFVYPAGGQQGTTFQIKLGGQNLDGLDRVLVTGQGVTAKVLEYNRVLNPQETTLLNEQLKELKRSKSDSGSTRMRSETTMMSSSAPSTLSSQPSTNLIDRIQKRVSEHVNRPASAALASIAYVEVTVVPDALPGLRELRLVTARGVSNPLVFCVGQLPEVTRKPMVTAPLQVLGKEALALRKRPANEVEQRITLPCTLNGQIASGELNRYRFTARAGQKLVITTQARQLIPFIADAVPGWFQPVLVLHDADGKEVAYDDDFRFKPDPTILYHVPKDGEYTLEIYDAIYRGREDFVYRVSLGEIPFLTSIFPLGFAANHPTPIKMQGWNLEGSQFAWQLPSTCTQEPQNLLPAATPPSEPGAYSLVATDGKRVSNPLPFAIDTFPETFEKESNNDPRHAQKVDLPLILNGRVDHPGDWDVFQFSGHSNQTVAAEVFARRLDSPLDSVLKLTDAAGKLIAFNDDHEDLAAGINTHHADSYFLATLPADGSYFLYLGDTAQHGGPEYGYRLRLTAPQPDFALRVVPSSIGLRAKSTAPLSVYVIRQDGFKGPIKLTLDSPPAGFSTSPASLTGTNQVTRLLLKTTLRSTPDPVNLTVTGTATMDGHEVTHAAVPAEDRMQAFLWRHLVPASELKVLVYDPNQEPPPKRALPPRPPPEARPQVTLAATDSAKKTKFTKQQVAGRLRQLKLLYQEGLLTDTFYNKKVDECEADQ